MFSKFGGVDNERVHNKEGVAGLAFEASIMPLKVLSASGGGTSADIIAFHGYFTTRAEDLPVLVLPAYQKELNTHGLAGKPIWDTEAGAPVSQFANEADRAAYLAKYYLLHWSLGISRFVWYSWDNSLWGTLWSPGTGVNTVARIENDAA